VISFQSMFVRLRGCSQLMLLLACVQLHCGARSALNNQAARDSETSGMLDSTEDPAPSTPGFVTSPPPPSGNVPGVIPNSPPPVTTPPAVSPSTTPTSLPPPSMLPPTPPSNSWASCGNPLQLDFAPGAGGTYTSFSNDAVDTVTTGCGIGKDVVFRWTAPDTGYFAFSAPNTNYDVSLSLFPNPDECHAPLTCNQGSVDGPSAYLEHFARVGETYLVALEGVDTGRFSLAIEPL
jgi:hypothetical protein